MKILTLFGKQQNGQEKPNSSTTTTTDLGIRLNGKLGLYFECLVNPKIGLNLVQNPL
jgi:hypothetical protein